MDNNDSSIKSMYLTLFILGIIETVFTLLLGNFVGIAVLVIALILRSKLQTLGRPVPKGINLMILGSGIHIAIYIWNFFMAIVSAITAVPFFNIFSFIISIFAYIAVFVILIIACIMIYKEYDAIK